MSKDPYRLIHKAIRARLCDVATSAGSTEFSDEKSAQAFRQKWDGIVMFLEHHAVEEEANIHTRIPEAARAALAEIEAQHEVLDRELDQLKKKLDEVMQTPEAERGARAHEFYLQLQLFTGNYLRHTHAEETLLLPAMQEHAGDDAFLEIARLDYAMGPLDQMAPMVKRMLPSLNADDLEAAFRDMLDVAPRDGALALFRAIEADMSPDVIRRVSALFG